MKKFAFFSICFVQYRRIQCVNYILALAISFLILSANGATAQSADSLRLKGAVAIKSSFLPFFGEGIVVGQLILNKSAINFTSTPCPEKDKASRLAPCNDHLISPFTIQYAQIEKVSRRNYLFIFPNRVYVRMKDNSSYSFIVNRRGKFMKKVRAEMQSLETRTASVMPTK